MQFLSSMTCEDWFFCFNARGHHDRWWQARGWTRRQLGLLWREVRFHYRVHGFFYWTRLKIRWIVLFCTGMWILSCRLDSSKTVSRCSLQCLDDWIIMLSGMWHTCCYYSRLTTIIHIPFSCIFYIMGFDAAVYGWARGSGVSRPVWEGLLLNTMPGDVLPPTGRVFYIM
jgi:hypothetical protein